MSTTIYCELALYDAAGRELEHPNYKRQTIPVDYKDGFDKTIVWEGLAEIQSLAVRDGYQRRGIGRRLVKACLAEARRLGALKVFVLTAVPAFFERMRFSYVPRETLPHKIWSDCVKCVKFPHCNELALAIDLPPPRARARRGAGDRGGA